MVKTRIHGKIKDKFVIRSKSSNHFATEAIEVRGSLSFVRYPAVFNSEKDAEKYLESFDLTDSDKEDISIENTDISFFNNGAILITFD